MAIRVRIENLEGSPEAGHQFVQVKVAEAESGTVGRERRHLSGYKSIQVARRRPPAQRIVQVEDNCLDRHGVILVLDAPLHTSDAPQSRTSTVL